MQLRPPSRATGRPLRTLCLGLGLAILAGGAARAQVSTNDAALQALQPAPAPQTAPAPVAPPAQAAAPSAPHKSAHPAAHTASAARPPAAIGKLPAVPAGPPPNLVLVPPPQNLPAHQHPTPPPVPVLANAPGTASPIEGGVRILFGPGSAAINPATEAAILGIADKLKADPQLRATITAFAPGTPEDPSTPRRLSLDRALAARALLIHAGIASERVLAVAKGFNGIEAGPPERMDVLAAPPKAAPPGKPTPPPAAPGSQGKTP